MGYLKQPLAPSFTNSVEERIKQKSIHWHLARISNICAVAVRRAQAMFSVYSRRSKPMILKIDLPVWPLWAVCFPVTLVPSGVLLNLIWKWKVVEAFAVLLLIVKILLW